MSFYVANQKAIDDGHVMLYKIHLFLFRASLRRLLLSFIPGIWPLCKKQNDVSFLCVCPLIDDKLHHNIVKAYWGIHSYFDNVMTQFIIDERTDG